MYNENFNLDFCAVTPKQHYCNSKLIEDMITLMRSVIINQTALGNDATRAFIDLYSLGHESITLEMGIIA